MPTEAEKKFETEVMGTLSNRINSATMTTFVLRSATGKDDKKIRGLIFQKDIKWVKVNPIGLTWKRFIVAESIHGEFIGCGKIKQHFDGSRELASIVVEEDYQRNGVAKAIIEHLLSESKRPVYGMCPPHHVSYYSKFGFYIINEKNYPPYFQIVNKIVQLVCFVFRQKGHLIVMRLD